MANTGGNPPETIYDHKFDCLNPNTKLNPAENLKGKVVFFVSTDSNWGWTKSTYSDVNTLYDRYNKQGLEIIIQPCGQWLNREPLSGNDLLDSISTKFKPKTPWVLQKNDVQGETATDLWKFLRNHPNCRGTFGNDIKWNFTKFIADRNGIPRYRFAPSTSCMGTEDKIKKLLEEKPNSN